MTRNTDFSAYAPRLPGVGWIPELSSPTADGVRELLPGAGTDHPEAGEAEVLPFSGTTGAAADPLFRGWIAKDPATGLPDPRTCGLSERTCRSRAVPFHGDAPRIESLAALR